MGFRAHVLKHIKFDELTEKQRNELKKRFQEHKRELEVAMKAVDRGLSALAKKPKRKT